MERPAKYWNAVAKSIEAEDDKARIYASSHRHTLGVAREAILRAEMRRETAHPFVVTTGIVSDHTTPAQCSNQVDILVHNPQHNPPPLARVMSPEEYIVNDFAAMSGMASAAEQ